MIPRKFEPLLFGFFLSGLMSLLVAGIATLRAAGVGPGFVSLWVTSWLTAWLFAFPAVLVVSPFARRLVRSLLQTEAATGSDSKSDRQLAINSIAACACPTRATCRFGSQTQRLRWFTRLDNASALSLRSLYRSTR